MLGTGSLAASLLAVTLAASTFSDGPGPTPDFNARPTQRYACESVAAAPGVWSGHFFGRKEIDLGYITYWRTMQHVCFLTEQDCRNWLYNMQSIYRDMVWRAECRPGLS